MLRREENLPSNASLTWDLPASLGRFHSLLPTCHPGPGLRWGWGGDLPGSPGPLEWGISGTSVESLCSVALLEVLVLVGSSGACSKVPATPRMPFFPSSFSTSKNHQKQTHTQKPAAISSGVILVCWFSFAFYSNSGHLHTFTEKRYR